MHPYLAAPRPHVFAHRGASGEAPENTLEAFARALAQGASFLEMDCHATRDGEIVILHDADVERVTQGKGLVREHTLTELRQLDAGFRFSPDGGTSYPFRGRGIRIPLLREVLESRLDARINLEVKQAEPSIAADVVALLHRHDAAERVLLAAEQDAVMAELRQLNPGTAIGFSRRDVLEFFQAVLEDSIETYRAPGDALQIPQSFMGEPLVTPRSIAAARRLGVALHVWTVNDVAEMRTLLELGVDGIMTDFPGRLVGLLRSLAGEH